MVGYSMRNQCKLTIQGQRVILLEILRKIQQMRRQRQKEIIKKKISKNGSPTFSSYKNFKN